MFLFVCEEKKKIKNINLDSIRERERKGETPLEKGIKGKKNQGAKKMKNVKDEKNYSFPYLKMKAKRKLCDFADRKIMLLFVFPIMENLNIHCTSRIVRPCVGLIC